MTSNVDVEIGDDIWITDPQHPYYGKAGKAITVGQSAIGVRLNGSTSPVGIHVKVGQFRKVTFHKNWHRNEPAVRHNPDYELPFSPPASFTAVPFHVHPGSVENAYSAVKMPRLSDSAIEWADGQRAARIDNLKKTVAFLQREIERLEGNSVTFKVEHNAPERTYNFAKDTVDKYSDAFEKARLIETDDIWLNTDQDTVMAAVWKWLQNKGAVGADTGGAKILDGIPWRVTVKHSDSRKQEIFFSLSEREEVIKIIDFIEDGQKQDEPESDDKEPEDDGGRNRRLHLTNAVWGLVEHERLQNALLEWICIQDWMTGRDLPTFMINIHNPWWIKIDSHGVERLLSLEEREEVIDMIHGDSK